MAALELVDQIALESGFDPSYISEHGEHAPGKSLFSYAFASMGMSGMMQGLSSADFLWTIQCNVILQLAEKGPCVIVGRNADYILKDREDCLHVFIHADTDYRADRIVRLYGESEIAPLARLEEKDKRRRVNYEHYTGRDWGKAENYHIALNSAVLSEEACVDFIVSAVQNSK